MGESKHIYVQRYVSDEVVDRTHFQVVGGQLHVISFVVKEVRFLSLMVTTMAQYTTDGKHISCHVLYYVDSLV